VVFLAVAPGRHPARHLDVAALQPEQLDSAKLTEALDEVARRWSERTGVAVEFTTTGNARELHPEIEATLLRVTQEALANVENLPATGEATGFGLPGMRHRIQRLAGTLNIESEPGGGTAVSANVPAGVAP
jgi:signal transduction histidine kinase